MGCGLRIQNLVLIREAELELGAGLNAVTGETGAGKTIFAQAIGLLLGAKRRRRLRRHRRATRRTSRRSSTCRDLEDGLEALAELRPEDEDEARARAACFRRRTHARVRLGASVAREDVAEAAERLIAMSGQFEQRRLARPAYQLDDTGRVRRRRRGGARDAREAWQALQTARKRAESERDARRRRRGSRAGGARERDGRHGARARGRLRAERDRLRHVVEIGARRPRLQRRSTRTTARARRPWPGPPSAPCAGRGAGARARPVAGDELRDGVSRLGEVASGVQAFGASLETDPGRLDAVESRSRGSPRRSAAFTRDVRGVALPP